MPPVAQIELFCDNVPRTTFNFLALAASGYYDETVFHRNIKGFMLQGGDPTGTGKGGAAIWGAKFEPEMHPDNTHSARGIVSMAALGSNGSQFFITYAKHAHLDNSYAVFGKVRDSHRRTRHRPRPGHSRPRAAHPCCCPRNLGRAAAAPTPRRPQVIDGWETLDVLERLPCSEKHRPLSEVRIEHITIHANPLAEQMIVFPSATGPPDIQT